MIMRKSEYILVAEELKRIRRKVKTLRQTPTSNTIERIEKLKEINQLLTESNDLLIIRQKILANRNELIEKKINVLESRLK